MPRQSITFTEPNDEWLSAQVTNLEYSSKSEVINDLIRRARAQEEERNIIRQKLEKAEASGYSNRTAKQILDETKKRLKANGK